MLNVIIWNDCIKRFCSELKELGTKVVNYEQKEMTSLTYDENRYYEEWTYVKMLNADMSKSIL